MTGAGNPEGWLDLRWAGNRGCTWIFNPLLFLYPHYLIPLHLPAPTQFPMRYEHDPHYGLPLPDDFRTFYPYTPNEVKHRRRTTSAQLKVLESIFRVDTKPNATLRNDLAAQLGMTARGVQVWFQNRRAKEKNKANKKQNSASAAAAGAVSSTDPAAATSTDASPKEDDEADQASPPPATPGEELLEELLKAEPPHDVPSNQHVDSQTSSPSPALTSPPKLHLLTDPAPSPSSAASWKPTLSDETPPDSAVRTDGLSPSLSPRPLHAVRASLPDTSVFTSSRRYVSQIPGPLPEPNFTFGAPSLSSPTDDEPSSPDLSSYSFPPKDDSTEDDDVMSSLSFDTLSRFGSAVSIATSESSVFSSPAFYDIGELAPNQDRRSSWYVNTATLVWHFVLNIHFLFVTAGLPSCRV
ncbi:Homeobox protein HD-10 [Leucoagaricus sp. SymC.cos]|nr:Homeobox protein HD-10 [Leucoagaricus sp. SymC.cos]